MALAVRLWGLVPVLPGSAWVLLGADALSAMGSGMTLPFLMVYLHTVRGLSLGVAGAATATVALAGLVGNPVGGAWVDRFGPRPVLAVGWATAGLGSCGIAVASRPWQAFLTAAVLGLGAALAWPAQDTLLSRLAPEQGRSGVFALRHATLNLGLAVGGFTAALIADTARPSSFTLLYALDAASFALAIPLLWLLRAPSFAAEKELQLEGSGAVTQPEDGYRTVVKDRLFRRLWVLVAILVAVGFAQFNSSFPVYLTSTGMTPTVVGSAFAANMVTVTVAQLLVLRLLRRHRRTTAIVVLCALWACSWAMVLAGGHLGAGPAAVVFVLAAVTFGLGETLFAPTVPALVNGIAPEALRGRYNGAAAFAYTAGFATGPALGGILFQHHLASKLLVGLMVACALAALLAVSVRHLLPAVVDLIDTAPVNESAAPSSTAASDRQEALA